MKKKGIYDKWMKFFQSKVFQLEAVKFKIQDKFFSNYNIEKIMKRKMKCKLEKAKTDAERDFIIRDYKQFILDFRKEKYRKENMNYHLDIDNPEKTLFWLNKNKSIHKRGLKKNLIKIPLLILLLLGSAFFNSEVGTVISVLSITGLSIEAVSTFINANCILLQNYNIQRINNYIEGPYQKRKLKLQRKAIEYSEVTDVVSQTINEGEDIPSIDEVISNIQTKEQAQKLLKLIQKEMNYRETSKKQKVHSL